MQMDIPQGNAAYFPNSLMGSCPHLATMAEGGFTHFEERIDAKKVRGRSESFSDHFSQPALFYRSLADWEKEHVAGAYSFELGKCTNADIVSRMLYMISQIDTDLAKTVSKNLGMPIPKNVELPLNQAIGADADGKKQQPGKKKNYLDSDPSLSQANTKFDSIATRKIAVLIADGFDMKVYKKMKTAVEKEGAMLKLIAPKGGTVTCNEKMEHKVDAAISTTESVLYDALYIPGGKKAISELMDEPKCIKFINETFKYCKAIAVDGEGEMLLDATFVKDYKDDMAIHINKAPKSFIDSVAKHRNWERRKVAEKVPV